MMALPLVTLTPDAQGVLDRYLRHVRTALQGHPSVDAEEVERDVRGHIEAELAEEPEPVTAPRLRGVLDRLGSPAQWVPTDDLPLWRRAWNRLRSGPEEWRLAYLTFACFVVGPMLGPIGPLVAFASFPMARATLALLAEHDEAPGARRWLVYPPLIMLYATLVVAVFVGPAVGPIPAGVDPTFQPALARRLPEPFWLSFGAPAALWAGLYWTILGLALARFRMAVRYTLWPFADWFERRHGQRVALVGLVVALAGALALAFAVWR